jgi:hypothetical protein
MNVVKLHLISYHFCSEAEKKTTLDQSLRGVLGDQIVSTHVLIYLVHLCHVP